MAIPMTGALAGTTGGLVGTTGRIAGMMLQVCQGAQRVTYTHQCNHCGAKDDSSRPDTVTSRNVEQPFRCAKCGDNQM
jgi:hypothetical protein